MWVEPNEATHLYSPYLTIDDNHTFNSHSFELTPNQEPDSFDSKEPA